MEPLEALREAGRIAAKVRDTVVKEVRPGARVIDLCDRTEALIRELGAQPAFPTNVDIDQVAAHYCSPLGDTSTVPERSLVKLDVGVHVEGYIADTAITACFDPGLRYLVEAAEAGLKAAMNTMRPGISASDVGSAIEQAIRGRGAKPIRNLTGHKLARYVVHAGESIPNVAGHDYHVLAEGEVYAVEPFAVPPTAEGLVMDGPQSNIYRFMKKRSLEGEAKRMLKHVQEQHRTLPFASRWVMRGFQTPTAAGSFSQLLSAKCIMSYPQLVERSRAKVAQAEHTVILTSDGCEITTA
ncbi:type II methionyl aminopeptidase [Candidatus Bathyarchaeota archaeon RBG_16_57_9]|jgi:methionyl aminopeptidase|nr:MAG: type II methionyl aminopeptidase [Candidatus Bathyarchaeota archaeon RBG_16_57_9]OGD53265.1 MAG: type II methionyl aminopeptidase [Candidatus Bathyarchaeota archaeon RBG_13_60_20]